MSSSTFNTASQASLENKRRRFLKRTLVSAVLANGAMATAADAMASSSDVASASLNADILLEADNEPAQPDVITATMQAEPSPISPSILDPMASRKLHLVNVHTGDEMNVVYYTHGVYIDENIYRLNHLMRDRRANKATDMDIKLYDQLISLRKLLDTEQPVHILSGYRTPETNAKLRRRSKKVAKHSLHIEGRAADVFIPGVSVEKLHKAALSLKAGGVGLYSKSHFIHMDTGAVRLWGS